MIKKNIFIASYPKSGNTWLRIIVASLLQKNNDFELTKINKIRLFSDLSNFDKLSLSIKNFKPEIVFHLAAQPLVIQSYLNPIGTYKTNVIGTLNLLEAMKDVDSIKSAVIITTDKVYKNLEKETFYKETDVLGGFDMYSSSKACCEILTESFRNSFFNIDSYGKNHNLLISTARAGNVIGGGDWAKNRLIPDLVNSAVNGKTVEIRNPSSVRPWQHVLDCISGYLLLGATLYNSKIKNSGSWNFSPNKDEIFDVETISNLSKDSWIDIDYKVLNTDKKFHEANLLMLDNKKAQNELGWKPKWDTKYSVLKTIEWYKNFYISKKIKTESDITDYFNL